MFKNHETKKKNCRLCRSKNLELVYKFNQSPVGDDYSTTKYKKKLYDLMLMLCKKCNFVQLSNVIDPKVVYGNYIYVTKTSHGLSEHFQKLAQNLIKKEIVKKKGKVLEIGSNDGTLLNFLKKKSDLVVAVDPAAHLFKDKNVENIAALFSNKLAKKISESHGKFDTIIANNVLANIDDLDDIFLGVKKLLNYSGHLVIETFSLYGVLKNNLIDNVYHEHLSYFTIESLKKFAKKFGLNLKSVEFLNIKGGSYRFIFQNKNLKNTLKISKLIQRDKEITGKIKSNFKKLQKINSDNSEKVISFLNKQIKNRKKIGGFGASVGTTTLIYDMKLKSKINYLYDNEKRRFNLYCPGTGIKVLNPKNIKKNKIDYLIIFAWRYVEVILKRNKKLFDKGVKFILPHPKFKILKN